MVSYTYNTQYLENEDRGARGQGRPLVQGESEADMDYGKPSQDKVSLFNIIQNKPSVTNSVIGAKLSFLPCWQVHATII